MECKILDSKLSANNFTEKDHVDDARRSPNIPPDGGWGWVVTLASFIIAVLVAIPSSGFGLLFSSFFLKHTASSTLIAWIYNVNLFVWSLSGMLGGPLCAHFGWRKVITIGGSLVPTAIILSGFVSRPEYLFITYSFLAAFTLVSEKMWVMLTMSAFGFSVGIYMGLISLTIIEFMGLESLSCVLGVEGFCVSILYLTLGPLLGILRDVVGGFNFVTRVSSVAVLGSCVSWLLLPYAIASDRRRQKEKDLTAVDLS